MANLYQIVGEQFPNFVRSDYPVFVEFVQNYYKWVSEQQSLGKFEDILDIDKTIPEFVKYFRRQLDIEGLFVNAPSFNTKYLKRIKEIYTAKGSEQALVFLLRVVHNTDSKIVYPGEFVLRPSDANWFQEMFITVQTLAGAIPADFSTFFIIQDKSSQRVEITRYEEVAENTYRIYFRRQQLIFGEQIVEQGTITCDSTIVTCDSMDVTCDITYISNTVRKIIIRNSTGGTVYLGSVIQAPSFISVEDAGQGWQLGQVIIFPGTEKDTIARVARVNADGGIERVEIIEFGQEHPNGQTLIISPYKVKPLGSIFNIVETIVQESPLQRHFEVTIEDTVEGITEQVNAVGSGMPPSANYWPTTLVDGYNTEFYVGNEIFNLVTSNGNQQSEIGESGLTLEEWLASRATLVYNYDVAGFLVGRWSDERSQISTPSIKLQDNFYYQQFSYEIEAPINPSIYIDLAYTVHPAGLQMFQNYQLDTTLQVGFTAVTSFPYAALYLGSGFYGEGNPNNQSPDATDVNTDNSETLYKSVAKLLSDAPTTDESLSKNLTKYYSDTASISSPDTSTYESGGVYATDYFSSDYTLEQLILILGA